MRSRAQFHKWAVAMAVLAGTICFATVEAPDATSAGAATAEPALVAGTLNLRAELQLVSQLGACPPGVSASACAARTGTGVVPGLGRVTGSYTFVADVGPPPCAADLWKARAYPIRLVVAGQGEIRLAVAEGDECVGVNQVRTQTQAFTITGGTGVYQGASGSGRLERTLGGETATGRVGRETWTGTLAVPGLDFDLTPPAISGAAAKTVRVPRGVKRVRVTYAVTARDGVDGAIPAKCTPRSGSRFPIGRTPVTCTATDSSGNTKTARFTITVRSRR